METQTTNGQPVEDGRQTLRNALASGEWKTRSQLAQELGWDVRDVRSVAEDLGGEIVRGQHGYKLTAMLTAEELNSANHTANAWESQIRKMQEYVSDLRNRLQSRFPSEAKA